MDSTCATRSASACAYCGAATSRGKYCSERCKNRTAWERRKKAPCSICGAATGWPASDPRSEGARCRECTKSPCGTTAAYGRGCRCTECRAANTEAMREYVALRKAAGRPVTAPEYSKVCEFCASEFITIHTRARFCSLQCAARLNAGWSTSKALVPYVAPPAPRRRPTPNLNTAPRFWGVLVAGPCRWCGVHFIGVGSQARYCSKRCARSKSQTARGLTFKVSPRFRREIYERDNWTCQLCGEPVDRGAHYLDDWAPSLDHIEPQSQALIPDHSAENLRCAHRWCNAIRGDGTYHADLFAVA